MYLLLASLKALEEEEEGKEAIASPPLQQRGGSHKLLPLLRWRLKEEEVEETEERVKAATKLQTMQRGKSARKLVLDLRAITNRALQLEYAVGHGEGFASLWRDIGVLTKRRYGGSIGSGVGGSSMMTTMSQVRVPPLSAYVRFLSPLLDPTAANELATKRAAEALGGSGGEFEALAKEITVVTSSLRRARRR